MSLPIVLAGPKNRVAARMKGQDSLFPIAVLVAADGRRPIFFRYFLPLPSVNMYCYLLPFSCSLTHTAEQERRPYSDFDPHACNVASVIGDPIRQVWTGPFGPLLFRDMACPFGGNRQGIVHIRTALQDMIAEMIQSPSL